MSQMRDMGHPRTGAGAWVSLRLMWQQSHPSGAWMGHPAFEVDGSLIPCLKRETWGTRFCGRSGGREAQQNQRVRVEIGVSRLNSAIRHPWAILKSLICNLLPGARASYWSRVESPGRGNDSDKSGFSGFRPSALAARPCFPFSPELHFAAFAGSQFWRRRLQLDALLTGADCFCAGGGLLGSQWPSASWPRRPSASPGPSAFRR